MRYLNEYKDFNNYRVFIEWEHGDADLTTHEYYDFKSEDDMDEFLHFIYDLRMFVPNSAYENQGHFQDGHYQRIEKWTNQINLKYKNKFSSMIPSDEHYRTNDYRPKIESIHVEIAGVPQNIVWKDAIKTNIISLPNIGDELVVSVGHINGGTLGPEVFGGKPDDYFDYEDFEHTEMNVGEGEYDNIKVTVIDCVISDDSYRGYEQIKYVWDNISDSEIEKDKYMTYHDFITFGYYVLCTFGPKTFNKKIVTEIHGYDPKYETKFHRGMNDYYFI